MVANLRAAGIWPGTGSDRKPPRCLAAIVQKNAERKMSVRARREAGAQRNRNEQGLPMTSDKYLNAAQQRVLSTLLILADHDLNGLAPGEVARRLGTLPSNTTRDLANLRAAGLAETTDAGRWRITARLAELAVALQRNLEDARRQLEETRRRYSGE
jgi:DNA-binding MarR family transcriptional regulator